ncbi:dTDP-4-dehydrorhamnose 3,5-epimerase [Xaviernesmea oryzae]|uniref:dTDP-4-dehydrorhamnose 3,5-epimerase n=1 Tax=Xaviernesmea oryzae TaxID=464029 RepID=A0A1Q9AXP6_9HYPH|nr:dTDP-4-dehydrorhamnose 3,5-epimerase [Xaviernesmea oryzae]OLP60201.1 dTDP-4-dehydrorhamnose 3,5-epimerase [Xaviernesmea oryzae]SEK28820.1 dTDP-4-dehydrorhamnose 3,5-epimerase [Xaviernesmea oryzae]
MIFERLDIPDVCLIKPKTISDTRGMFRETFRQPAFDEVVGPVRFVQDNQSLSMKTGTVRGLHFQQVPMAQGKLVQCVWGAIFDVAVDIRPLSPSFGQHVARILTAENGWQLWIPAGFAHGFCTLAKQTVVTYKLTEHYSASHDRGILWNDPDLGIDWPIDPQAAIISDKDAIQPTLRLAIDTFLPEPEHGR